MKNITAYIKRFFIFSPETPKKPFILEEPPDNNDKNDGGNSSEDISPKDKDSDKGPENKGSDNKASDDKDSDDKGSDNKGSDNKGTDNKGSDDKTSEENKREDNHNDNGGNRQNEKDSRKPGKKGIIQPVPISARDEGGKDEDDGGKDKKEHRGNIHSSLKKSIEVIKEIYTADINGDFKIREFRIRVKDEIRPAFACFFDGMVNTPVVNTNILQPLMTLSLMPVETKEQSVQEIIYNHLIPQNQIQMCKKYQEVVDEVNFGGIGIFVDGLDTAFAADVKGWEHRSVESPTSELNIRGPREAFSETNRMNSALLRKTIKDENLIVEDVLVGVRSKTPCSLVYIKNIANSSLVDEVRRRLKSIRISYLRDSGELEQFLEDSTLLPAPQMLLTERPDRVAAYLCEGRVGIIVHGSPFVIIVPVTLFTLLHSPEDSYLRYPYATLLRLVRIFGILISLLLPSLYLSVTNYHHEMLPTDLLLAIASSREKVPFPTIVSILIMEVAFELIREAGIRIPGPIGPTLGIVGALILGQAAVAANLVSPILIIIVAVTGIGSFAIPDFSLGYSFRAMRFIYLLLASIAGFLGIALCTFIHLLLLVHAKSFGIPFLAPFAPKTTGKHTDTIIKTPLWKEEDRPDYINPKDVKQQPFISRGWVRKEKGVQTDERKDENR